MKAGGILAAPLTAVLFAICHEFPTQQLTRRISGDSWFFFFFCPRTGRALIRCDTLRDTDPTPYTLKENAVCCFWHHGTHWPSRTPHKNSSVRGACKAENEEIRETDVRVQTTVYRPCLHTPDHQWSIQAPPQGLTVVVVSSLDANMTSLFGLITTTEAERRERQILLAGNRVATINKYTPLPNREAGNEKRLFVRGAAITLAVSLAVLAGVSVRTRGTAVSTSVPVINDGRPQHQSLSAETHITGASPSSHLVGETSTQETWECGAASGAVLGGADVVAYFSLSEDDAAVFGTQEHASVYNGYLFWFSSEDNKVKFEVRGVSLSLSLSVWVLMLLCALYFSQSWQQCTHSHRGVAVATLYTNISIMENSDIIAAVQVSTSTL